MQAIADTGYLVALLRREDEHHAWAHDLVGQLETPLLTCEAVIAETSFHLSSVENVLTMMKRGAIRIAFDLNSHLESLFDLSQRYQDRNPDLADLCLIRMSELFPRHLIVTVDSDFKVYRRNKREVIPLLCPPGKR